MKAEHGVAIAPVVGSARTGSAARGVGEAFGQELPRDQQA